MFKNWFRKKTPAELLDNQHTAQKKIYPNDEFIETIRLEQAKHRLIGVVVLSIVLLVSLPLLINRAHFPKMTGARTDSALSEKNHGNSAPTSLEWVEDEYASNPSNPSNPSTQEHLNNKHTSVISTAQKNDSGDIIIKGSNINNDTDTTTRPTAKATTATNSPADPIKTNSQLQRSIEKDALKDAFNPQPINDKNIATHFKIHKAGTHNGKSAATGISPESAAAQP